MTTLEIRFSLPEKVANDAKAAMACQRRIARCSYPIDLRKENPYHQEIPYHPEIEPS
jgi:hypothetical protein